MKNDKLPLNDFSIVQSKCHVKICAMVGYGTAEAPVDIVVYRVSPYCVQNS